MKLEFGELDGSSLIAPKYFLILPHRILASHTFQLESPFSSEIKFCKRADHIAWWPCWPNDVYNNHNCDLLYNNHNSDLLKMMINDKDNILQTRRSHDLVALLANYGSILYIVAFFPVIYVLNRSLRGAMLMCMWVLISFFDYATNLREAPWLVQYLGNIISFSKCFWLGQYLRNIIISFLVASWLLELWWELSSSRALGPAYRWKSLINLNH